MRIVLCSDLSISNAQCSNLVACQGEMKVKLDRTSVEVAGDQGGDDRLVAYLGDVGNVKSELVLLVGLVSPSLNLVIATVLVPFVENESVGRETGEQRVDVMGIGRLTIVGDRLWELCCHRLSFLIFWLVVHIRA